MIMGIEQCEVIGVLLILLESFNIDINLMFIN